MIFARWNPALEKRVISIEKEGLAPIPSQRNHDKNATFIRALPRIRRR
jgi:hypothetical protein